MSLSPRRKFRSLSSQRLESRRLLAGDSCGFMPPDSVETTSGFEASLSAASNVSASDAGSTRATAAQIGNVDGTRQLAGTLGWFDASDTIAFSVERDADVQVVLSELRRDADLYLTNSQGEVLDASTRYGRNEDVIEQSLDAGDYFVHIVAQSFRSNRYQLTISADLQTPVEVTPEADPVAGDPQNTGSPQDSDDSSPSVVAPLADVSYFGGSREWNLNAVNAPEAWAAGYTGEGITVAVVDTGVDLDHPDLVGNLFVNAGEIPGNGIDDDGNGFVDDVHGYDFADNDAIANDVGGHGTHVAGTIAADDNGFGATGVAPDARILPVRVLGANGSGNSFDVAAGIRYAADLGADIINLSLGGGYSRAIETAIDYARSLGSIIVAAAGNESASTPSFPARFSASDDNVISVGAFSSSGRVAGFSNDVGSSGSSGAVQVDAPGVGIYSSYVGGGYATLSGTSMAAPHVAGLAALTLSANPNLTSSEVRDLLASGTVGQAQLSDSLGSVSASQTVAYAAAGLTTVDPDLSSSSTNVSASSNTSSRSNRVRSTATVAAVETERSNDTSDSTVREATIEIVDSVLAKTQSFGQTNAEVPRSSTTDVDTVFQAFQREVTGDIDTHGLNHDLS